MIGRYLTSGLAVALIAATTVAWVQWERASAARAREEAMSQQYESASRVISHQMKAIEMWRDASLEAARLATEAENKAQVVRVEYRERIRVIELSAPPPDTSCTDALAWASEQYMTLAQGWRP